MKTYRLYLESGPKMKTTMVHVFELLGCIANARTTDDALEATPGEIRRFLRFLAAHGEKADPEAPFETTVAQHVMEGPWIRYGDPTPGFEPDFEPLTRAELATHLQRLRWIGEEVARIARETPDNALAAKPEKGRALIDILPHIAGPEPQYGRSGGLDKAPGANETVKAIEAGEGDLAENLARLWGAVITQFEAATDEQLHAVRQRGQSPYTVRRSLRRVLEHPWEHLREIERRLAE